jgi:poly-gamma-glutamate system protein
MNKIRAKSNIVLGALFILSLLAFIAVENSKVEIKQLWYKEKLEAARLAQKAAGYIKNFRMKQGVFVDDINDPNETALIGQEYTLITTDRGYIKAKLTSLNPNFAAVIVQMLKDAGVKPHDNVAVGVTGSFPAMNIALYAALQTLELNPVIISSVGSSNWGANDPDFTWPDMENLLFKAGIFKFKSVAASKGGGLDKGRGLSPQGRNLLEQAILRNNLIYINEEHLENSIRRRMEIYDSINNGKKYAVYINVGGGIASLGNTINGKLIPAGLTEILPVKNYPVNGVIIKMGEQGIPIIHLLNIEKLARQYGLPESPVPLPEPGDGKIFYEKRYNLWVTGISTFVLVALITFIFISEEKYHKLGNDIVHSSQQNNFKDEEFSGL